MRRKTITTQELYCAVKKTQSPKVVHFEDQYQMAKESIFCNLYAVI